MGDADEWLRGLWRFYLAYTDRPIHAASAALFAIFALLVFVDPLFAALAIAAYVTPPVVLYVLEDDAEARMNRTVGTPDRGPPAAPGPRVGGEGESGGGRRSVAGDGDSDPESAIGADSDSDGTDTDSDSDSGGTDTDTDSDGADTDTDSDG